MSLIMDALKKAQQLRLKEFKGAPFYRPSELKNKGGLTSLGRIGRIIGAGLACLFILLFVLWRLVPSPLITQPNQVVAVIKNKPSIPITKKPTQEPSKDILSQPMDIPRQPKEILSLPKNHASPLQAEKSPAKKEPSIERKREEPSVAQMAQEKKGTIVKPQKKTVIEKSLTSAPPSGKEQVAAASIDVKKEEDKYRTLMSDVLTHFNSGIYFHDRREFSKAIQAYQKVIELDPAYIEAYNNLGIIYYEMGNFDRAFGAYQKSIEINPQYEKGHNNIGILLFSKGRHEEAIEAFEKALAINPNNIETHLNLGILFKRQGQSGKAIESYQKALAINPLQGEIHYTIAGLYEELGNFDLAIAHYQNFIQLSSRSHPGLALKVQERLDYLSRVKPNPSR